MEEPIPSEQLIEEGAEVRDGASKSTSILRSSLAIVSMIASSLLIWMLLRSKKLRSSTYHRLILGLGISDILYSIGSVNFNALAPIDDSYYVWNAHGNQLTCNINGFIILIGAVCGLFYSCSVNLHSLVVVKHKRSDNYISQKIEPFLHGVPILLAAVTAIVLLVRENINSDDSGMCFAPVYNPPHCKGYEDGEVREGFNIPCGRGRGKGTVATYFLFFLFMFEVPVIIAISLGLTYRAVLKNEKAIEQYGARAFTQRVQQPSETAEAVRGSRLRSLFGRCTNRQSSTETNDNRRYSRAVLHRACAYSLAYFLTWSLVIARSCTKLAGNEWPTFLWYMLNIMNPLQGFYHLLVFLQPKVLMAKRSGNDVTWAQAFRKAFWSSGTGVASRSSGTGVASNRGQPNNSKKQQNNLQKCSRGDENVKKTPVDEEELQRVN